MKKLRRLEVKFIIRSHVGGKGQTAVGSWGPDSRPTVFSTTSAPAWRSFTALRRAGAGWEPGGSRLHLLKRGRQLALGPDVSDNCEFLSSCTFISIRDRKCLHTDRVGVWLRIQIPVPGDTRRHPHPFSIPSSEEASQGTSSKADGVHPLLFPSQNPSGP